MQPIRFILSLLQKAISVLLQKTGGENRVGRIKKMTSRDVTFLGGNNYHIK